MKRLEKFDKLKMTESADVSVKARKSYENLTTNGGIDSTFAVQYDPSTLSSQRKQWIANNEDRKTLVLWKRPLTTLQYFVKELFIVFNEYGSKFIKHQNLVLSSLLVTAISILLYNVEGPHQKYVVQLEKAIFRCLTWIGLGVLSSVGFGTGLHTFVLYLGPHIAKVTLAAYSCNSLDFPQPPYPDEIICPEGDHSNNIITIFKIMSKVRLEAFMWGMGTALGELPPYFMAKAARLSGQDHDDDDLKEFEELIQVKKNKPPEEQSIYDRAKLAVEKLVERAGFLGILACASIPNPLFDLAGITCGHFNVPFWTFFGATLIGKAIIKMHIQKLFVIIAFNETLVHELVNKMKYIPYIGKYLHAPLEDFLAKQKANLRRKPGTGVSEGPWIAWIFEKFVFMMILYYILTIVNSMAQSHHKRLHKRQYRAMAKVATD